MAYEKIGKLTTGEIREILNSGDIEKVKDIPKEDLDIFFENEQQRNMFSKDGIKNLYSGICEKAVEDYKIAHRMTLFSYRSEKTSQEETLEKFFGTTLFLNVTGLRSKEHAIKTIEKTMIEERRRRIRLSMV